MRRSVILFIPTLITGGAEKLVVDLAVNMDKENFDVSVAVVSGVLPEGFGRNQFLAALTENHIGVDDLKGRNKLETMRNIQKLFRNKRPDIIHANLSTILYVMVFAAVYGTKTRIFTFHNVAGLTAGGFKKLMYRFAFKILKFVPVAICDYVKTTISEEYHIPLKKIPCIYNGVDTKAFCPNKTSNRAETVEFISTGILYYMKNHKLLINAFAKAARKHPAIHLSILGDGELREELEQQIREYGLEDKINIMGLVDQVADLLNQADIYVMSSNLEGLPLAVLEALACGLPIITTRAGGVVDIVRQGENGFVTPVGNAEALAEAMIALIENAELRKAMGEASRTRALELDIRNCVENYQWLYQNGKLDGYYAGNR